MKKYMLTDARHGGSGYNRGEIRTDGDYPKRIGRIGQIDFDHVVIGQRMLFDYIEDKDGNDLRGKSLFTSFVKSVTPVIGGVVVETKNTILIFKEIKE